MLRNAHQGTSFLLKNYIDQVLNGAINHYNSALTIAYNKIATLEAEVICLQGECYESPKKEQVSHTFKHLVANIKSYNTDKI